MRITHQYTIEIAKGMITVLALNNGQKEEGITIVHDAKRDPVRCDTMANIEAAVDSHELLNHFETITQEVADKIETPLTEWLGAEREINYRFIRWEGNDMIGLETKEDLLKYIEENSEQVMPESQQPKKRFMLG